MNSGLTWVCPVRVWPLVILGPSGAGKSILLRILAGLETPEEGRIRFGDQLWFDHDPAGVGGAPVSVPSFRRSIGYCLQDPMLFPHLTVGENVAYPLAQQKSAPDQRARREIAREELDRWGAGSLAHARPDALSVGEQGRVALARAFVRRPELLLLDEPLAALDPLAREDLLGTVRRELQERATPAIWVTHDQSEAMILGGTTAVLLEGRVAQAAAPEDVFRRPANPAVAAFVGVRTVLHGLVQARETGVLRLRCGPVVLRAAGSLAPGTPVVVSIRSEDVELLKFGAMPQGTVTSARNELPATVTSIDPLGFLLMVELDAGVPLTAAITRPACEDLGLEPGGRVLARIKAVALQVQSEAWGRG